MLISLRENKKPTGRELYLNLWKRTKCLLKNWEKVVEENSEGVPKKFPFVVHHVTTSGLVCARCDTDKYNHLNVLFFFF